MIARALAIGFVKACGFLIIHAWVVGCASPNSTLSKQELSGNAREQIQFLAAEEQPLSLQIQSVPRVLELDLSQPLEASLFEDFIDLDSFARNLALPVVKKANVPLRPPSLNVTRAYVSGRVALLDGNFDEAIARLEYVVNRGGGSVGLKALARAYEGAGDTLRAAEIRMRLDARGEASSEDVLALAEFFQRNRKLEESVGMYARVVQMAANELRLRFAAGSSLADTLELQGNAEAAALCRLLLLLEFESKIRTSTLSPGPLLDAWLILALSVADDYARAGLFSEAVLRWQKLRQLDLIDSAVIRSRLVYGLCKIGYPIRAQALLADEILGESDIELIRWMREMNVELGPLMDVLWERQRVQPENMLLVRTLAAGSPERAGDILKDAALQSDDPEIRGEVVRIAMEAGPEVAFATAAGLATTPKALRAMSQVLLEGPWPGSELIEVINSHAFKSSSDYALAGSILSSLGRPDLSWILLRDALDSYSDDSLMRIEALRSAGLLGEPDFIDEISIDPPQAAVEAARVSAMLKTGEIAQARILADIATAQFNTSPEVFEARGRLRMGIGEEPRTAAEDLLKAIQLGRDDASVWLLALVQAGVNPSEELRASIRQCRTLVSRAADVDRLLAAENAMSLGRFSEAESIFRDLSDIPELREVTVPNLFLSWRAQGRLEFARSWLESQITRQPAVIFWRQARMWLARETGELPAYIEELQVLNSECCTGQYESLLIEAAGVLGQNDLEKEIIRERLLRQPPGQGVSIALIELAEDGDPEVLIKKLTQLSTSRLTRNQRKRVLNLLLLVADDVRSQLAMNLVQGYISGKEFISADELSAALRSLKPDSRSRLLKAARPEKGLGIQDDASWFRVASERAVAGDLDLAAEILWFALAARASFVDEETSLLARPLLGYALCSGWSVDRIIESFDLLSERGMDVAAALEMTSVSESPWLLVAAGTASTLGKKDQSLLLLDAAYQRAGGPSTLANNLGFSLLEQGIERDRAELLILEANRMNPEGTSELDSLGWLRYMQGKTDVGDQDGALFYIKRSILNRRMRGDDVPLEVLMHLGDASWRAGNSTEAVSVWNQILELRGGQGQDLRYQEIYADWMKGAFGAEIIPSAELWQYLDGKWVDGARERLSAIAEGNTPKVTPQWEEIDAEKKNSSQSE